VCGIYDELLEICRTHGIAQELQWAVPLRGRALVELGDVTRGLDELERGLEAHVITRSTLLRPYYFVLYAGALLRARRFDVAQRLLDESREITEATSQHAYDSEHRRLQAEVFLANGDRDGAERLLRESLSIATAQGARWLELRAARGYASFLLGGGRQDEARAVLQICDWFTEGRDTLDFVYAEALLRTLPLVTHA
jgi:predicted ATPase